MLIVKNQQKIRQFFCQIHLNNIAETILGFLPQLEKGDWIIAQTGAVNRACAKMANLEGKDAMECAKADMIYECSRDLFDGKKVSKNY